MDTELAKQVSIDAVKAAGKLVMESFLKVHNYSFKAKSDIQLEIDKKSEELIIGMINESFPQASFLAEESGLKDTGSKYKWVLDPIDGTINYFNGTAPFRIALCLLDQDKPVMSTIYDPLKDELFFAQLGMGATLNGKKIQVTNNSDLSKSLVMTHLSSRKEPRLRAINVLDRVFDKVLHMRMLGCSAASFCYVAQGKFDVFFQVRTLPWDILPGALLIEEAGGKVTDMNGNKYGLNPVPVLATNGKVHDEMLELIRDV